MADRVVLSPYLRPTLQDGVVVYDNGITESRERLSPLEDAVVRALWEPLAAPLDLQRLYQEHGRPTVLAAIESLRRRWMVFSSEEQCTQTLDTAMGANVPDTPFVDQIELTNRCPMRCGFCPRGVPGRMTRPMGSMDPGLFERLLSQLSPWQSRYRMIELHHLGESLLHPELGRFVQAATDHGVPTELSVNPSLLTPALARQLIDSGLRRLVVSLDGMDDETLRAVRGHGASYTEAARNLSELLEMLAGETEPLSVVIQMLDLRRNRHQRAAFLERWGSLELSYVEAYVKKLEGPDPDSGEVNPEPDVYLCNYPWRSVVVLWDGRVVPCCRDHDGSLVLGDLRRESLRDLWHGPMARELRRAHRASDCEPGHLCFDCSWRRERFAAAMPHRHPSLVRAEPLAW